MFLDFVVRIMVKVKKSKWMVVIDGSRTSEEAVDFDFSFTDVTRVLGPTKVAVISQELLEDLIHNIKTNSHYNAVRALKKVRSPEGRDLETDKFYAIFGITKSGIKLGFLLKLTETKTLLLVGLWPPEFAQECKENSEFIDRALSALGASPESWERVDFLVPPKKDDVQYII